MDNDKTYDPFEDFDIDIQQEKDHEINESDLDKIKIYSQENGVRVDDPVRAHSMQKTYTIYPEHVSMIEELQAQYFMDKETKGSLNASEFIRAAIEDFHNLPTHEKIRKCKYQKRR